jgi:ABC-2 type transport system ATP-binding protein
MIILDSTLRDMKKAYIKKKILTLTTDEERLSLDHLPGIRILENAGYHFVCEVDVATTPMDRVIAEAMKRTSLKDVTIEDPSMEEIIRTLYAR